MARIDIDPGMKGRHAETHGLPAHKYGDIARVTLIPGQADYRNIDARDGLPEIPVTPIAFRGRGVQFSTNHLRSEKVGLVLPIAQSPLQAEFDFTHLPDPVHAGPFEDINRTTDRGLKIPALKPIEPFIETDKTPSGLSTGKIKAVVPVAYYRPRHRQNGLLSPSPSGFEPGINLFIPEGLEVGVPSIETQLGVTPSIDTIIEASQSFMDKRNARPEKGLHISRREALNAVLNLFVGKEPVDDVIVNKRQLAGEPPIIDAKRLYNDMVSQSQSITSNETGTTYLNPEKPLKNIELWLNLHLTGEAPIESSFYGANSTQLHREAASRIIVARWAALSDMQRDEVAKRGNFEHKQPHNPPRSKGKIAIHQTAQSPDPKRRGILTDEMRSAAEQIVPPKVISIVKGETPLIEGVGVADARHVVLAHALLQDAEALKDPDFHPTIGLARTVEAVLFSYKDEQK